MRARTLNKAKHDKMERRQLHEREARRKKTKAYRTNTERKKNRPNNANE